MAAPEPTLPAQAHIPLQQLSAAQSPADSPWTTPATSGPSSPAREVAFDSIFQAEESYPPPGTRSHSLATTAESGDGVGSRSTSRSKDFLTRRHNWNAETRYGRTSWVQRVWQGVLGVVGGKTSEERGRSGQASASASGAGAKQSERRERAQKIVAFVMIALVGMNDSATGANLSSMQSTYNTTYEKISLVFLANVAGYFMSCISSSFISHHFGLNKALVLASASLSSGCFILTFAPPFAVFILALVLLGFGCGLYDAVLTTVVSHEEDGVLMSVMYAMFGIGAMIAPLVIGSFVDHGIHWKFYYYVPMSFSIILCLIGLWVFSTYEPPADESHPDAPDSASVIHARDSLSAITRMKRALRLRVTWVGFVLIMIAFAMSDTLSAWMVSYLVQKRQADDGSSRYMLSGLWGGIALGRVTLAHLLDKRLGERTFACLMLAIASGFLAIVWAVELVVVDAVSFALVGAFIGPVTPKVLSTVSARIPPSLKSSVMSLTIGLGLIGSAVGPLLFGMVASGGGLASLPGVLIVLSVVSAGGWLAVPRNARSRED